MPKLECKRGQTVVNRRGISKRVAVCSVIDDDGTLVGNVITTRPVGIEDETRGTIRGAVGIDLFDKLYHISISEFINRPISELLKAIAAKAKK